MKHSRYTRLLAGVTAQVAKATNEAADMIEIDDDNHVDAKSVMRVANEIRERLLWIEREATKATPTDTPKETDT